MPAEIFWEISPPGSDNFDFGTVQRVRFRRPQLIKAEDIVSVFRERLQQSWWGRQIVIDERGVLEQTEEEPAPILRDEKVLSIKKTRSFPLKITSPAPTNLNIRESLFCVVHNVPLEERRIMGACTWLNFTQPLTEIELKINSDWWYWNWRHAKKDRNEARAIYRIANSLYWFFQGLVNNGELVEQLSKKSYDLKPQFDPSWTNCVMEDQCQECGEIHSSLPHKLSEVKVGEISKNYCHCRWKKDRRYSGGIERQFKVIGAYPISSEEADIASCEGSLMVDSAYD